MKLKILAFAAMFATTAFALSPGMRVCAKWSSGWYLATLIEMQGQKWKVLYADGDKSELTEGEIRELPWNPGLNAGDRVLSSWNGSPKMYGGKVLETLGLSYKIKWDDGSEPSWVPAAQLLKE